MVIGNCYNGKIFWVMVYDTGHKPDEPEVEMVEEIFFDSPDEAHTWFRQNKRYIDFINPRAVPITGFTKLEFVDPLLIP